MRTCPRDPQLQALVDEQLDPGEEARIVGHVEECQRCQDRLDDLTSGGEPHPSWIPLLVPPAVDHPESEAAETNDHTVDLARFCALPASDDVNPTEPELVAGCRAPPHDNDDQPVAYRAVKPAALHPVPNAQVTTDAMPAASRAPISDCANAVETAADPGNEPHIKGDQTVSQTGASAAAPRDNADSCRSGRPEIPGYELFETLGEGGMGVVYKARQIGLNRLVALKMIIGGRHSHSNLLARFRVEAEAVARIRHPNILQIYDIGEVDGLPFVSLELLEGGGLDDRLAGTPQPGRSGSELVATLARAIHAAHQAGIVHRDLKPSNVLFTADGAPKITDFGLAKRLESDSQQTATGQVMGSPSYMAPEQARGQTKDVGPSADVYALGAILYETLTGRPPFKGETPIDTVRQVIDNDPVSPSRLVPRVARDLETICLKCLNKEPQKRYGSAQDLADDLDRYRDGKPIMARPTPALERGYKWSRRRPVRAVSLALGIVAFLGVAVAGVLYQRHQQLTKVGQIAWEFQQQNRGVELLGRADKARTPEQLQKAQVALATFLQDVEDHPNLERVSALSAEKYKWVGEQLRVLSSRDAERERDRADRESYQKFLKLAQEAQLYAAGFVTTDRLENIRTSAHAALTIYAKEIEAADEAWTLVKPLPLALTATEQARVVDSCYDLLLIRSQAASPAEGLRILDQAVRLAPRATAAYHLRRADCLERARDFAGRDRENQAAGQLKPATAQDYFLSGRELAVRRQFDDAVRPLKLALELDRDQTSAHLLLAVCYLNMQPKRLSEAASSLDICIRINSDLAGLYLLRALVSGEEGNQARIASERPGDTASASRRKQQAIDAFEAAEADYRRALGLHPKDDLRYVLLANRGLLRLQSGRFDAAVEDLQAAIRLRPNQHQAHATLAQVFQRTGRPDEAHAALTRGIGGHSEPIVLAGFYRNRALLYAPRKDLTPEERDAALRDLDKSLRLEPDKLKKASDHVWRARLCFGGGQALEALAASDAALTLVPDDPEAHRVRISALMELKRYEEVLASSDVYLAGGKPSSEIFEIRGLAHVARREYTAAIGDFNQALELTPEAGPARRSKLLNLRGWSYHFADAPRLALTDFEESLRLDSNQSDAHGGRGLARARLGQWRPAVTDAEAAVRLAKVEVPSTADDRQAQVQALYNAAKIYALAVAFAAREVSRQGERAADVPYRKYRSRALDLLEEAVKQVPDRERREQILNDPALRPLRRGPSRRPGTPQSAGLGSPGAIRHVDS